MRRPKAEQTQTCVGVEELKGLTPFSLAAAVLVVLGTAPGCPRELLPAEAPTPLCRHSPGCARFPHTRDSSSGRGPKSFRSTLPRQRTNLCSWGCSPAWDSDGAFYAWMRAEVAAAASLQSRAQTGRTPVSSQRLALSPGGREVAVAKRRLKHRGDSTSPCDKCWYFGLPGSAFRFAAALFCA